MNTIYALALAAGAWTHPGSAPCGYGADNPCWTPELAPETIIEARDAGEFHPDEICDGDLIANTGARDGRAFETGAQIAAFDVAYLADKGLRHRITDDGRACIPTMAAGAWHEPEACGNRTILIRRADGAPLAPLAAGETFARAGFPNFPGTSAPIWSVAKTRITGGARSRVEAPPPAVSLPWPGLMLLSAVATLLFCRRKS